MTTTPDDDYPDSWKPAEVRRREDRVDAVEAELWLASLSPAELQATLLRVRGIADAAQIQPHRLPAPRYRRRDVGGRVPVPLTNILSGATLLRPANSATKRPRKSHRGRRGGRHAHREIG